MVLNLTTPLRRPLAQPARPSVESGDRDLQRRLDGCEVVRLIKADPDLRCIPVIVLSSSKRSEDVASCYTARANAYIMKPANLDSNLDVIQILDQFWFHTVTLPA